MPACEHCGRMFVRTRKLRKHVRLCLTCRALEHVAHPERVLPLVSGFVNAEEQQELLVSGFSNLSASAQQAIEGIQQLAGSMAELMGPKMQSTATVWVSRDPDGKMQPVRVVDMQSSHLRRWILYFRKKFREQGAQGDDAQIDVRIRAAIITAPAIYAEARKRKIDVAMVGLAGALPLAEPPAAPRPPEPLVVPGQRLITLDDE